jgi:hypothetical protein
MDQEFGPKGVPTSKLESQNYMKHRTKEIAIDTINRFKNLKETIGTNSREIMKDTLKIADTIQKERSTAQKTPLTSEQQKALIRARESHKYITKKEILFNFKLLLRNLRDNCINFQSHDTSKSHSYQKLTFRRLNLLSKYQKKLSTLNKTLSTLKTDLIQLPKQLQSLRKAFKNSPQDPPLTQKHIDDLANAYSKKLSLYSTTETTKNTLQTLLYTKETILNDKIEKKSKDLRNLKILRADNRLNLKNIFLGMMKGAYEAEYYELSLVDVRFEMDRLGLGGKGGRVWEGLDEGNVRYVGRMSEGMRGMRVLEFKI